MDRSELCLGCGVLLGHLDRDPNGDENATCARCRAEENHDFDADPNVTFDRAGNMKTSPSPAEQASGEFVEVASVEAALQKWLDWCGQHNEEPEARSGARIAIAALSQRPVEAYLIERLSGEGYGRDRKIVDAKQYNAMSAQFWINDEARQRHRVTPLAPQQPEKGADPMTDDRKRNTGGEVERFAFEIRAMATKKDVVLRLRRADAIVKQVNAALAESRAECERLQEQADWCSDALRIEIGQFVGANATLEALTIRACNDLARYKPRAERLAGALREWWLSKRPASWNEASHRAYHRVNCTTKAEETLADAALEQEQLAALLIK